MHLCITESTLILPKTTKLHPFTHLRENTYQFGQLPEDMQGATLHTMVILSVEFFFSMYVYLLFMQSLKELLSHL